MTWSPREFDAKWIGAVSTEPGIVNLCLKEHDGYDGLVFVRGDLNDLAPRFFGEPSHTVEPWAAYLEALAKRLRDEAARYEVEHGTRGVVVDLRPALGRGRGGK